MAEIADEPDEYLSDEETGSVSNTKEKGSSRGAAKYRTKFNTEREGSYPVKRVQSDPYSFWCVPCNKRVRCDHQGLKDVKVHCERESHKMVVAQSKTSTVFRNSQLYINRCHKSRGSGYKFLDTTLFTNCYSMASWTILQNYFPRQQNCSVICLQCNKNSCN